MGFLKPYSWTLPAMIVLGMMGSFAEGFEIGLLIPLLEVVLHQPGGRDAGNLPFLDSISDYLRSYSELEAVLLIGVGMFALVMIKALVMFAAARLSTRISGRINHDIRRKLFRQMLDVDYGFLMHSEQGRLVSAFETQMWRAMDAMLAFLDLVIAACGAIVVMFLLFLVSWRLTIMVTILGGVVGLLVWRPTTRHLNHLGDAAIASAARVSQRVLAILGGMRVVRAFAQEDNEQARFDGLSSETAEIYVRANLVQRLAPVLFEVAYVPIFVAALVAAPFVSVSVPTLLVFLLLFYRLQPQIRTVINESVFVIRSSGAIVELATLLDPKDKPVSQSGFKKFTGLQNGIRFDNVSFDYQSGADTRRALSEISLDLRAREMTAIVGMSGAGKSTLINLLYRFYEPTKGAIVIDDMPLADFDVASWRSHLGLAGQDAALIDGTILENIVYGCRDAGWEAVVDAARAVAIHDFIEALPRGYRTEVGERGLRLSEGQRQRIGLARALLRQPDILVLDEATNALDGLTEQVVQQTLDQLAHRKTVIVIAHRLSTIRKADHVVVLSEGKVMEQGSPLQLLSRGGVFSQLHTV